VFQSGSDGSSENQAAKIYGTIEAEHGWLSRTVTFSILRPATQATRFLAPPCLGCLTPDLAHPGPTPLGDGVEQQVPHRSNMTVTCQEALRDRKREPLR
jgi:hypothetical protein